MPLTASDHWVPAGRGALPRRIALPAVVVAESLAPVESPRQDVVATVSGGEAAPSGAGHAGAPAA